MVAFLDGVAARRPRIPVSAAEGLGGPVRRTTASRLLLALAILAALAFCVLLASELRTRPNSYFASGGSGVVVSDLSSSVDPNKYRRLSRVFRTFGRTNQPLGNRNFHPLWEAIERKNLVAGIHFGGAPNTPPTPTGWPATAASA